MSAYIAVCAVYVPFYRHYTFALYYALYVDMPSHHAIVSARHVHTVQKRGLLLQM